jgi:NitT/TauT family transport system ATP-binding protein
MNKDDIILNIDGVTQYFGNNRVLYDVDIKIVRGQFVAVVGGSGCGKSTLLKAIEGTQPAKEGVIYLNGKEIVRPTRRVGMVHQKYDLFDFLTTEQNVAEGLRLDQTTQFDRTFRPLHWWNLRKKHLAESRELLIKLGLGHALNQYPAELSGGMQQRAAIAQALIMKPEVLLLDEPYSALDESNRGSLNKMLQVLYQENMTAIEKGLSPPYTILMITHELQGAFYCCDRVIGLSRDWSHTTSRGTILGRDLGATKVYDKAAPVHYPDDPRNNEKFNIFVEELKSIVFDPQNKEQDRYENVSFWPDLAKGVGTGVALATLNGD